ncbi:MAG TPA: polysaccharide deacetylase family protein, partial [Polyangiaceae bacterium]|nr:polysaccharide deacetylase family protein [Polyangiaceae bacterium]
STGGSSGSGGTPPSGWPPNAVAAVTLTYDDGLDTHLHNVGPVLDAAGLKGTFFLSNFEGVNHDWALPDPILPLSERHLAWVAMGTNGHELASHTVNHPCNSDGKAPNYHLTDYDMERMATELDDSIARLTALSGTAPFTFAYPCSSDNVGLGAAGEDYSPLVAERFFAARVSMGGINDPATVDLLHVANVDTGDRTGAELRAEVDQAIAEGGWLVFLFHGVGVETLSCPANLTYDPDSCMINYLVTAQDAHDSLVAYLAEKQDQVWSATFKQVATAIAATR